MEVKQTTYMKDITEEEMRKVVRKVMAKYWLVFKMLEEYDKSRKII